MYDVILELVAGARSVQSTVPFQPTEAFQPMLALLVNASVKATLVLLCAFGAMLALHRASAATRHLVWAAAIIAVLLLPFAQAILPAWQVEVQQTDPETKALVTVTARTSADGGRDPRIRATTTQTARATRSPDRERVTVRRGTSQRRTSGPAVVREEPGNGESTRDPVDPTSGASSRIATERGDDRQQEPSAGIPVPVGAVRGNGAASSSTSSRLARLPLRSLALLVWAAGTVAVAIGVLVGLVRVHRLGQRADRVTDGRIADRARELAGRLGLRSAPRILQGGAVAMPMTWGIRRAIVLLPSDATDWSDKRLDSVLLHELAHIRRRDYLIQLAADIACALHWFNPLAWLAARRLRVEREHACDDHVLFAGERPSTYAGELLELARSLRPAGATAFAAMSMARPSQLTGRLLAVLDENRRRRLVSRRLAASIGLATLVPLLPLAALTPAARSETVDDPATYDQSSDELRKRDERVDDPAASTEALDGTAAGGPSRPISERALDPGEKRRLAPPATASPAFARSESRATEPRTDVASTTSLPVNRLSRAVGSLGLTRGQCWEDGDAEGVNVRRSSDDDVDEIEWRTPDCEAEARIEGRIRFNGDFTRIASISPGGLFRIETDVDGERRRLEVRPGAGGRLVYDWEIDGDSRPFDAEASAWLQGMLQALLRMTGYAAEERVAWLLEREGVAGVLAEVDRIPSDFVQRRYLTELLEQADPDVEALARVIARAGMRLDSDYELAQLLIQVAEEQPFTEALRQAFITASNSLGSDYERSRVLTAALTKGGLSGPNIVALIDAANDIGSDFEQARLLITIGETYSLAPAVQGAYLRAAANLGSDFEHRRVLDALLAQDELTAVSLAGILDAAQQISSDFELARLLKKSAQLNLTSPEIRRAYLAAASSIDSDFELKGVLVKLIERDDLGEEMLRPILETARAIDSDFELANVLVTIVERYPIQGELRGVFLTTADRISSDHEYGRVASALIRHERDARGTI